MPAIGQDFEVWRGQANMTIRFPVANADGTLANLTGAVAMWRAAYTYRSAPVLTKMIGAGLDVVVGASAVDVTLSAVDFAALTARDYFHQLDVILAGGVGGVAALGTMTVNGTLPLAIP